MAWISILVTGLVQVQPAGASVEAATAVQAAPAAAAVPVNGDAGGGDPYFPKAGNGGYDVKNYDLKLKYDPRTHRLDATAVILASSRLQLQRFNLDLRGFNVTRVHVNGKQPSRYEQSGGELNIQPATPLPARRLFVVTVAYSGTTRQPLDNTGAPYGWYSTEDGALVANEPEGASTWYPVNDVPYDKATYRFTVTVPQGTVAVANGLLRWTRTSQGWTTFRWDARDVQASYVTMAASGNYTLTTTRTPAGLPIINAVDKDLTAADKAAAKTVLDLQPAMISFFSKKFGPYPFSSFGAVIDDDSVGYALENQTRPIYSGVPGEGTVAHELAHQWFGNSVTLRRWRDIWLNEGFAVYAQWLWSESRGGPSPQARFDSLYTTPASDEFWATEVADPGATGIFDAPVYSRGAMTLQALRQAIGDTDFFTVLRRWAQDNAKGVVSTADLIALSEQVSGKELDPLFTAWLSTPTKPAVM